MVKRRKTTDSGKFIKIGDKTISLEKYLAPSKPKESKSDANVKDTSDSDSMKQPTGNVQSRMEQHRQDVEKSDPKPKPNPTKSQGGGMKEEGDRDLLPVREKLPIWKHRDEIRDGLRKNNVLIIAAETGSGKSTQVPQFLFTEAWCRKRTVKVHSGDRLNDAFVGGVIAVTQPRRVAAITLANRVSQEAGTPMRRGNQPQKGTVGFSVRFDRNLPIGMKIKFVTEGMLLQEMLYDPHLRQYSAVIVDEVHERSLDADLVCGFLKQIVADNTGRGGIPLKVVMMSATANVEQLKSYLTIEGPTGTLVPDTLEIPGRLYPVDLIYTPRPVPDIQEALLETVFKIHKEQPCPGDILAFFTGQETIETARKIIDEHAKTLGPKHPKLVPIPLYGQQSSEEQQKAFRPVKSGGLVRKVVLATNIAETSVTVPGVRYVVDPGKAKVKQFRKNLQMDSLLASAISKSSAIQRAGRAGREAPGKCYRLYTEEGFKSLEEVQKPEIMRVDIQAAVLTMKARGIDDIHEFPLIDSPNDEVIDGALLHLHILQAIHDDHSITEMGKQMATLPLSPQLGRVLLAAADPKYNCLLEAIDIISCLTAGEEPFHQIRSEEEQEKVEEYRNALYRREGDLLTYLTTMQRYREEETNRTEWCKLRRIKEKVMKQAMNIRKQLGALCVEKKLLSERPEQNPQPFNPMSPERAELLLKCFLTGFATKTAILAPDASYVTTQGQHKVAIHPSSVLHGKKKPAIMFTEHVFTTKSYARTVSAVQSDWVTEALDVPGN